MSEINYKIIDNGQTGVEQRFEEKLGYGSNFFQISNENFGYAYTITSTERHPLYAYVPNHQTWQQIGNNSYTEEADLEIFYSLLFSVKSSIDGRSIKRAWVYVAGPHYSVANGRTKYSTKYGDVSFAFIPAISITGENMSSGGFEFDVIAGKRGYESIRKTIETVPGNLTSDVIKLTPGIGTPNLMMMVWTDRSDYMYAINQIQYKIDKTIIEHNIFDHAIIQTDPLGSYTGSDLSQRSITYPSEGFPDNFSYVFLPHRFDSTGSFANNDFLYWKSRRTINQENTSMEYDANKSYSIGDIVYYKHQYYEAIEEVEAYGPLISELWREEIFTSYTPNTEYAIGDIVSYAIENEIRYFQAVASGFLGKPGNGFEWSPIAVFNFISSTSYMAGVFVLYNEKIYYAIKDIESKAPNVSGKWRVSNSVYDFENTYLKGSICVFQKVWYESKFDIYSRAPGKSINNEELFWNLQNVYEYDEEFNYEQGSFVKFGSGLYRARRDLEAPANCLDYSQFYPVYLERGERFAKDISYGIGDISVIDGIYYIAKDVTIGDFDSSKWIKISNQDWNNDFDPFWTYQNGDEVISFAPDYKASVRYKAKKETRGEEPSEHPESWQEIKRYDDVIRNTYLFNPRDEYDPGKLVVYEYKYNIAGFERSEMRPFISKVKIVNSTPYNNLAFWRLVNNFEKTLGYDFKGINVVARNQQDVDTGLCFTTVMPSPSSYINGIDDYSEKYWQRITLNYDPTYDRVGPGEINTTYYAPEYEGSYVDRGVMKMLPVVVSGSPWFEKAWLSIEFEEIEENKVYDLGDEVLYDGKLYECIQYASKKDQLCFDENGLMTVADDGYFHFEESKKLKTSDWRVGDYRRDPSAENKFQIFVDYPTISRIAPDETIDDYHNGYWAKIIISDYNDNYYYEGRDNDDEYHEYDDKVAYNGKFYQAINGGKIKGIPPTTDNWVEWYDYRSYQNAYEERPLRGQIYQSSHNEYEYVTCVCPDFIQGIPVSDKRYWKLLDATYYDRSVTYVASDKIKHMTDGSVELYVAQDNFTGIPPESEVHWLKVKASDYSSDFKYYHGDVARVGEDFYEAITDFDTPLNRKPTEHNYWKIAEVDDYSSGTTYMIGDVVKHDGLFWRFKGLPQEFDTEDVNWQQLSVYRYSTQYHKGNFVSYDDSNQTLIYRVYADTRYYGPEQYEGKFVKHFNQTIQDFKEGKFYEIGDLVRYDGQTYCLWPLTQSEPTNLNNAWEVTGDAFDASRSLYEFGEVVEYGEEFFVQTEQEKIYKNVAPDEDYYWKDFVIEPYDANKIYKRNDLSRRSNGYPVRVSWTAFNDVSPENTFFWKEIYTDKNREYSPSAEYSLNEAVTYKGEYYYVFRAPALICHHPFPSVTRYYGEGFSEYINGDNCWSMVDIADSDLNYEIGDAVHTRSTKIYTALLPISAYSNVYDENVVEDNFYKMIFEKRYKRHATYQAGEEIVEYDPRRGQETFGYYYVAKEDIDNRFVNNETYWESAESIISYDPNRSYDVTDVAVNSWSSENIYYRPLSALDNIYLGASAYWEKLSVCGYYWHRDYTSGSVVATDYDGYIHIGDVDDIEEREYETQVLYQANTDIVNHEPYRESPYWEPILVYNFATNYDQYRDGNLPTQMEGIQRDVYYFEPMEDIHTVDIDSQEENVVVTEVSAATEFTYWHKQLRSRYRPYNNYAVGKMVAKRYDQEDRYFESTSPIIDQCPHNRDLWERFIPYIPFRSYEKNERVAWCHDNERFFIAKEAIPNTSPTNLWSMENPDGYWKKVNNWDVNEQYNADDVVNSSGRIYKAKIRSKGQYPGYDDEYWVQINYTRYGTSTNQRFNVGDVVEVNDVNTTIMKYNGFTDQQIDNILYQFFIAVRNIDNVMPKDSNSTNTFYWSESYDFVDWSAASDYNTGAVIRITTATWKPNYSPDYSSDFWGDDVPQGFLDDHEYCHFYTAKRNITSNHVTYNDHYYQGNHQIFWHFVEKSIASHEQYNNYAPEYYGLDLKCVRDFPQGSIITDFGNAYYTDRQICYVAIKDVIANHLIYNDIDNVNSIPNYSAHKKFWRKKQHRGYYENWYDYAEGDIVRWDDGWSLRRATQSIVSNDIRYNDRYYNAENFKNYNPNHQIFWSCVDVYEYYWDGGGDEGPDTIAGNMKDFTAGQIEASNSKWYRAKKNIVSNDIYYNDLEYTGDHPIFWTHIIPEIYDNTRDYPRGSIVKFMDWYDLRLQYAGEWYDLHYGMGEDGYTLYESDDEMYQWFSDNRDRLFVAKVDVESNYLTNEKYWRRQRLIAVNQNGANDITGYGYRTQSIDIKQGRKAFQCNLDYVSDYRYVYAKRDVISNHIKYNNELSQEPNIITNKLYVDTAEYGKAQAIRFRIGNVIIEGVFDYFTEITYDLLIEQPQEQSTEVWYPFYVAHVTLSFNYPYWGCPVGTAIDFDNNGLDIETSDHQNFKIYWDINDQGNNDHSAYTSRTLDPSRFIDILQMSEGNTLDIDGDGAFSGDISKILKAVINNDGSITIDVLRNTSGYAGWLLFDGSWFNLEEIEILIGKGRVSHASNQMDIGHPIFWQVGRPSGNFNADDDHQKGDLIYRQGSTAERGVLICTKSYISNSPAHYLGSPSNLAGHKAFWEKLPEIEYNYYHGTQNIGNGDLGFKRNDVAISDGSRYYLSLTTNPMHSLSVEKYWRWNPMLGAKEVYLNAADAMIAKFPKSIPAVIALIVNVEGGWLSVFDLFKSNDGFTGNQIWATKDIRENLRWYVENLSQVVIPFKIGGKTWYSDANWFEDCGYGNLLDIIFESDPQIIPLINDDGSEIKLIKLDYNGDYSTTPLIVTCDETSFYMFCESKLSGYDRIWNGSKVIGDDEIEVILKHDESTWKLQVIKNGKKVNYNKADGVDPWDVIESADEFTVAKYLPLAPIFNIPVNVRLGGKNGDEVKLRQLQNYQPNNSEDIANLVDLMRDMIKEHDNIGYIYPTIGNNERWIGCAETVITKFLG